MTEPPPPPRGEPPDGLQAPPPAPVPGCRLCVATIGDAGPVGRPAIEEVHGPSFSGMPVLASDGADLAVIGRGPDGALRVWFGQPGALDHVGLIDGDLRLVSLVRHLDRWHLFGADADGRAWHGSSPDLREWTVDERFAEEHPLLVVHGATSMLEGVVVLGEVISTGRRMGWTLLEGAEGPYRAREITFPLMADHEVTGPVRIRDDEMGLVCSSGATYLVARTVAGTRGRSWTLSLLAPDVVAVSSFVVGPQMWVVGTDPNGGRPIMAAVGGRAFHIDLAGGRVCAGAVHCDQVVLVRCSEVNDNAVVPRAEGASQAGAVPELGRAQSSPAYIDSISVA